MPEYSADPSLQDVPLNPSEIEAYASDPSAFARDPRKVGHLLRRVMATVLMYKNQIQSLNRDVQDIQMSRSRAGAATTMSPRDAVRYLSPAELASVVEGTHRALLDHVLSLQTDAKHAKRDAVSEQNKARFVLLSVLEDTTIPQETRDRITQALATLPPETFAAPEESAHRTESAGSAPSPQSDTRTVDEPAPAPSTGLEDLFAESDGEPEPGPVRSGGWS